MSFLGLEKKAILVLGVANKHSLAYHIARLLEEEGVDVIYSVRSASRKDSLAGLLAGREVHVCDVEHQEQIIGLVEAVRAGHPVLHGLVHSIAFADYEHFSGTFHDVKKQDFLQAIDISCFSLMALARAFKDLLDPDAGVVTISISTTTMAAESYGYMAPVKAALDSTIAFLAKSFSRFSRVRFNAVRPGLLKTAASAGIPNYLDHYLFAEQATLRKQALTPQEVAGVAAFLLSPRSSGINGQGIVIDAGMGINYFDETIVKSVTQAVWPTR